VNLWFESLSLIGCCFILKYGTILDFIREPLTKFKFFRDLFKCALCLGFHIGFWKVLIFQEFSIGLALSFGFYSAAICWLGDHLIMVAQNYLYPED